MIRPRLALAAALAGLLLSGCGSGGLLRARADRGEPAADASARAPTEVVSVTRPEPGPPPGGLRLEEQVARVASELNDLQNALAKVMATARRQDAQLMAIERRLGERSARGREGGGAAPPGFAPSMINPTPSPGSSSATTPADDLFRTGMARLRAGELDAAVLTFYELIANHPAHPLRESAQFQVADVFYSQKDLRGALAEFESLLAAVPRGAKAPDALVKVGLCQRGLGDEIRARKTWERVIRDYPNSAAARQAQALLRGSRQG